MPINYKDYPRNWKTVIVPAIRKRSGNRCEKCGIQNGIVIRRHKDGTWSTPSAQEWNMINAKVAAGHSLAQSLKIHGYFRIVLTVAHYDQDKKNNKYNPTDCNDPENNLFHWCQKDHLRHDRNQHDYNRKYGRKWKENQVVLPLEFKVSKTN